MNVNNQEIPWSRNEIYVNLLLMIILITFGSAIIILKYWLIVLVFWLFFGLYLVVGRYVTCRHCDFLGKPCCSWCVGIIGDKLYKRSQVKSFPEVGLWKMLIFDVLWLFLAILTPYLLYGYYLITEGLKMLDWILLGIYSIIGVLTLYVHSKGCKKCPISGCPLSGKRKMED